MIEPTYLKQKIKRTLWLRLIVIIVAVLVAATCTLLILKGINAPRHNKQENTASAPIQTEVRTIDTLKSDAYKKLQNGDQAGGLKDLQIALAQAKKEGKTSELNDITQQIDFAKNSKFTDTTKQASPAAAPSSKDNPSMIVIRTAAQ